MYLNQANLFVSDVMIDVSPDSPVEAPQPTWSAFGLNEDLQLFALFLNSVLVVGARYTLTIIYSAPLRVVAGDDGMYWDGYPGVDGQTRSVDSVIF